MSNIINLLSLRYKKPLESLGDDWVIKSLLAFIVSLWSMLQEMFMTQAELVALLIIVIFLDMVTGIIASRRRKTPITSLGFRQSVVKSLEYFALLAMAIGISNVFSEEIPLIEGLQTWTFFFCIMTEFKSVVENLTESKNSNIIDIWEQLQRKFKKHLDDS